MNSKIDVKEELASRHAQELDAFRTELNNCKSSLKKNDLKNILLAVIEYPLVEHTLSGDAKRIADIGISSKQTLLHLSIETINELNSEEQNGRQMD